MTGNTRYACNLFHRLQKAKDLVTTLEQQLGMAVQILSDNEMNDYMLETILETSKDECDVKNVEKRL